MRIIFGTIATVFCLGLTTYAFYVVKESDSTADFLIFIVGAVLLLDGWWDFMKWLNVKYKAFN